MLDLLSWIGAVSVLVAFALNIRKVLSADDLSYMLLNAFGSTCLGTSAYITKSYAFVVVNVVWVLFALYSIVMKYSKPKVKA